MTTNRSAPMQPVSDAAFAPCDGTACADDVRDAAPSWNVRSPYVPLMPDSNLRLHDAHEAVPAPAFTTAVPAEPSWYVPG